MWVPTEVNLGVSQRIFYFHVPLAWIGMISIFVVGLADFVGMITMAKANPKWLGFVMEGYVFASIIFWIICYAMSRYSYSLEQKYKTEK